MLAIEAAAAALSTAVPATMSKQALTGTAH